MKPAPVINVVALIQIKFPGLILVNQRLHLGQFAEGHQVGIEREGVDLRDLRAFVKDLIDRIAVDRAAHRLAHIGSL